ncbi:uncharacterized protein LOC121948477 [Plectropomus leopardus]|uniref:uncharacterized protein LOC121948477 n=1 Tax=Plectropomus leopardus TaxID=160734 RepID=UPI001C4CD76E|nr:uncharacterized protein LOC121948477 [Plectropomus leopardus]
MEAVIGLLVMMIGVSHGVETSCDGRYDGAQCYGALGGTLVLQLMDSTSEIHRYQLTKQTTRMLTWKNNQILLNAFRNRSSFTPSNGTFQINDLSRNDEGQYKLEISKSNGVTSNQALQLTIQAPVSSVLLVSECLSQGEMRVSCSSEGGDSPQYSWTLDGRTLTDAELRFGNTETNNFTLKQRVSTHLVCTVRNHVSRISACGFTFINCTNSPNMMHISQGVLAANDTLCMGPTTAPATITETEASTVGVKINIKVSIKPSANITHACQSVAIQSDQSLLICGVRAAVVILALIGIAVYFARKKKKIQAG